MDDVSLARDLALLSRHCWMFTLDVQNYKHRNRVSYYTLEEMLRREHRGMLATGMDLHDAMNVSPEGLREIIDSDCYMALHVTTTPGCAELTFYGTSAVDLAADAVAHLKNTGEIDNDTDSNTE